MPDQPARSQNEPPSVELEGERKTVASCDVERNGGEADASGASDGVEDDGKRPMDLRKTSERADEPLEHRSREDSPGTAPDEPDEPGGETAVPGDAHSTQEGPRCKGNGGGGETSASDRDTWPGGCRGWQVESRSTEGVRDRENVVDGAEYDRIGPGSEKNERVGDTNSLCRDRWPGGRLGERDGSRVVDGVRDHRKGVDGAEHDGIRPRGVRDERDVETNAPSREMPPGDPEGDQIEPGDVESGRERQSVGDGDQAGGSRGWMDGATSGARRDSKRVETTPLAEGETGQHERRKRTTTDAPGPSEPPPDHPRSLTDYVDPPRRRGRLKTRPRKVSTRRRRTYQVTRTHRGRIGQIRPFVCVVYGPETFQERCQGAIREDEAAGVDRGRPRALGQRDH
jgi:hypothetical protein